MFKEWLDRRTTMEECENNNLVNDERLGPKPVPFGFQNNEWLTFIRQIQEGDELWEFVSPLDTWGKLCGRAGICLVRNGEIIDEIITMKN